MIKDYCVSNDTMKKILTLFKQGDAFDKYGNYYLKGFYLTGSDWTDISEVPYLNCKYGPFSENAKGWAYNDDEKFIYEYCEGDTYLTLFEDEQSYCSAKKRKEEYYKEY
jgi:hypothetical protein